MLFDNIFTTSIPKCRSPSQSLISTLLVTDMSSASQNLKQAASIEPSTTHQDNPQTQKRAATAELQSTNEPKRQKLQEQVNAEEGATPNLAAENDPETRTEQSPENDADREGSREPQDESNDGDAEDPSQIPGNNPGPQPEQNPENEIDPESSGDSGDLPNPAEKKIDKRSKWDKALDDFVKAGNKTGYFTDYLRQKGHNNRPGMSPDERRELMDELQRSIHIAEPSVDTPYDEDQPEAGPGREDPIQAEQCPIPEADNAFVASSFAPVDNLHDSASLLDIDLSDLSNIAISPLSTLKLRVDQVQNIAFMVKNAEGILQGVVNSNPHGTGKTVEALAFVFFLAQRRQALPDFNAHKATLVLVSHQALLGWQQAHAQFFSNLLTLYVCTKSSQDLRSGQKVPLSAPGLAAILDSMGSSNPSTSYSVILCTYDDFSSNQFLKIRKKDKILGKREFFARGSQLTEEAHEALQVGQKPVLFDLNFKGETLEKIGTLIADEAHEIKDPRTRKAQATYLVDADFNLLITASPADNRISDFRGLLFLLFKSKEWRFKWPWGMEPEDMLHMFSNTFDPLEGKDIHDVVPSPACPKYVAAMRRGQHLWRLNPHAYRWLGNKMKFNPEFSRVVLGALFRLVVFRRDPNCMIELPDSSTKAIKDIVGIPKTTVKTVELQMTAKQQDIFYDLTNPWFSGLFATDREEKWKPSHVANKNEIPTGSFDQTANARLNYVTADFGLSEVFRLPGNMLGSPELLAAEGQTLDPDDILDTHEDAGMTFYYTMTRRSTDPVQPPADRVTMIKHLVRRSPKLKWLLVTLDRLKQRKEKAIIFCYHPRTQWLIEGVCAMAEFNFLSLNNTHHKDNIRLKVIRDFNNPKKSVDFLLSTMELLGHGYDMSQDCHHMIVFELPHSIPQLMSAIGRVQRVGQTSEQEVSILTLAGSYDDCTLHRQYRKFATEMCATGVFHGRFQRPQEKKMQIIAAGELIRRQLDSRVNRSFVLWDRANFLRDGVKFWLYDNINLENFATSRFKENTLRSKALIDEMLAPPRSANASASASPGGGDPAGVSDDPEEKTEERESVERDGKKSVTDEAQPQSFGEQDEVGSAIQMDVDMEAHDHDHDNDNDNDGDSQVEDELY